MVVDHILYFLKQFLQDDNAIMCPISMIHTDVNWKLENKKGKKRIGMHLDRSRTNNATGISYLHFAPPNPMHSFHYDSHFSLTSHNNAIIPFQR